MNINAANALLKTLEEPPNNTTFILIANQVERLPITIRSRCREIHFRSPDIEIGLQWLSDMGLDHHVESYLMMANKAPLLALKLAEENEIENLRSLFSSINALWGGKKSSIELAKDWNNFDFYLIINHLNQFLHDLLKLSLLLNSTNQQSKNGIDTVELFFPVQRQWTQKIASSIDSQYLIQCIDYLQTMLQLGESPVDKQLLFENTAIQIENLALNRA